MRSPKKKVRALSQHFAPSSPAWRAGAVSEDMVERVARAISKARALPGTKPARTSDVDRRAARAAIEAMREPTEEMARYGSYAAENCIKEDPCGNAGQHVWTTLIHDIQIGSESWRERVWQVVVIEVVTGTQKK